MQTTSVANTTAVTARAKQRSAPLDPQTADCLLDLLSTNDAFRRSFKRSPTEALKQIGYEADRMASSPAVCFFGIQTLASKEQIAGARQELKRMFTSGLSQNPIQLDVGSRGRRLAK